MSANEIAGAICLSVILFFACDIMFGKKVQFQGTVVDGIYTPEQKWVTHDKDGSRTTTDPEKWELMILTASEAHKVRAEPFLFYNSKNGDIVKCKARKGWITNTLYFKTAIEIIKKQY